MTQAKTVTIAETPNSVNILNTHIEVATVGIQGPAGAVTSLAGKELATDTLADGDFLIYDSTSDTWTFTQVLDGGTFGS
ncbi:MAG: hypothetical protein VW683_02850 [Betaproteobacteria bacterium]